jgi:DNA-binding NarL/FixJ family response regulator
MIAIELGFSWFLRGEEVIGSGWIGRAHRLLDGHDRCVEHDYLRLLTIDEALARGDTATAIRRARGVVAAARRFRDETLESSALVGEGIALIKQGRVDIGFATLDEAMLPVVAGRVRPTFAGNIYCQLMSICHELADIRRAQQWTDATARWCEGFSDAVMFIGVCRVHRAQLLQIRGEWARAEDEIEAVRRDLTNMNTGAVGLALYELGEVCRMRGEFDRAVHAFEQSHAHGTDPHPGLALVWVAQGRAADALELLSSHGSSITDPLAEARLSAALVEAAIAADDLESARVAADAIDRAASVYASSGLAATAIQCRGHVQLAAGHLEDAIASLRTAVQRWSAVDAPWRVARARLLLAEALAAHGDRHDARLEEAAAARAFTELGVMSPDRSSPLPDGVTAREVEVLALVAEGLTNREIADSLVISERTVARHLANLYLKIGVGTRAAATTYAHRHGLVDSGTD